MNRIAFVYNHDIFAGTLKEIDEGYIFQYDISYLKREDKSGISLTLPLREEKYVSRYLFPFFDGLVIEGYLLDIAIKNWKIDRKDRFGILLKTGKDLIGSVTIKEYRDD